MSLCGILVVINVRLYVCQDSLIMDIDKKDLFKTLHHQFVKQLVMVSCIDMKLSANMSN